MLLVLVLAGVVFTGARPADAQLAPPAPPVIQPPPVVQGPTNPMAPPIPGMPGTSTEFPTIEDYYFWCNWGFNWGCNSGQPDPAPEIPTNPYVGENVPGGTQWPGGNPAGSVFVTGTGPITTVGGHAASDAPLRGKGSSYSNAFALTHTVLDVDSSEVVLNRWYAVQGFVYEGQYLRLDISYDTNGAGGADQIFYRLVENGTQKLSGAMGAVAGCDLLSADISRIAYSLGIEKPESGGVRFYLWSAAAPCGYLTPGMAPPSHRVMNGESFNSDVFPTWNTPGSTMSIGGGYVGGGFTADKLPGSVIGSIFWWDWWPYGDAWIAMWGTTAAIQGQPGTTTPWVTDTPDVGTAPTTVVPPVPTTVAPDPAPVTIPEVAPPDPALSPDTQGLIERLGGFFGDLIGAIWNAIVWLALQIWEAIKWLALELWSIAQWFWDQLRAALWFMLAMLLEAFRILTQLLGDLLSIVIRWLQIIVNAIVAGVQMLGDIFVTAIRWLGEFLLSGIEVIIGWLLDGISLLFEWLFEGISALLEWLLEGIGSLLYQLFVPDLTWDIWLDRVEPDDEHPIVPWADVFADNIDFGSKCGPTFTLPAPIDHTFNIPAPSDSGCPGNGVDQARTQGDDLAGDLWGYREAARTFMAFILLWVVGMRVLRSAPWANKGEMAEPTPDSDDAVAL